MNFRKLEKNIMDIVLEEQLKLGYRKETVRLYYPLLSLNRLLETGYDADRMNKILEAFCGYTEARLGRIGISRQKERFCMSIPAQGSEYVHSHAGDTSFLRDFINTIARHGVTMEEVLQQFYNHSANVHVEQLEDGEFDYLVYFQDGIPDDFRYCIADEGCHIIYHRFSAEDYEDL